ncbi:MAG: LppA family lipoprotein [Dermatophilaceae bacterium]
MAVTIPPGTSHPAGAAGPVRRLVVVLAVVVLALTSGGCVTRTDDPEGNVDTRNELMTRPSFEQAEAEYLDLLARVRAVIDQRAPQLEWVEPEPSRAERGGCGRPFHLLYDAESGIYRAGGEYATGAIDDTTWPGLLDAVLDLLATEGFTRPILLQEKPGDHEVSIRDPSADARIQLGTKVGTTLTLYGACHLPEAARRSPSPTT